MGSMGSMGSIKDAKGVKATKPLKVGSISHWRSHRSHKSHKSHLSFLPLVFWGPIYPCRPSRLLLAFTLLCGYTRYLWSHPITGLMAGEVATLLLFGQVFSPDKSGGGRKVSADGVDRVCLRT